MVSQYKDKDYLETFLLILDDYDFSEFGIGQKLIKLNNEMDLKDEVFTLDEITYSKNKKIRDIIRKLKDLLNEGEIDKVEYSKCKEEMAKIILRNVDLQYHEDMRFVIKNTLRKLIKFYLNVIENKNEAVSYKYFERAGQKLGLGEERVEDIFNYLRVGNLEREIVTENKRFTESMIKFLENKL